MLVVVFFPCSDFTHAIYNLFLYTCTYMFCLDVSFPGGEVLGPKPYEEVRLAVLKQDPWLGTETHQNYSESNT